MTEDASEPVEVTATHREPDAPGFRPVALNRAEPLSSSPSTTVPAARLLLGMLVLALNAEYEAWPTTPRARSADTGQTSQRLRRTARRDGGFTGDSRTSAADGRPPPRPSRG
ncbi:hypothetical protein GCM10009593_40170 [Microlunatus antarcticus]